MRCLRILARSASLGSKNSTPLPSMSVLALACSFREISRKEQASARTLMEGKGVEFFDPSDADLAKMRKHLMSIQDKIVKDLKHDPALVQLAKKALGM